MTSVFWDARTKGVVFIDHLEKSKTVTEAYYAALLAKLKAAIEEKRPGMARKKVVLS